MATPPISAVRTTDLRQWTENLRHSDASSPPAFLVHQGNATASIEAFLEIRRSLENEGGTWIEATPDAGREQSPLVAVVHEVLRHLEESGRPARMATALTSFGWTSTRQVPRRLAGVMDAETHRNQVEALRSLFCDLALPGPAVVHIPHAELLNRDCVALLGKLLQASVRNPDIQPTGRPRPTLPTFVLSLNCVPADRPPWIPEFMTTTGMQTLHLEDLGRDHIRSWLASDAVVERFALLTGGRQERMEALLNALPADLDELTERRMSTLSPPARKLVHLVMSSRTPLAPDILTELLNASPEDVSAALQNSEESGLLECNSEGLWRITAGQQTIPGDRPEDSRRAHLALAGHHEAIWRSAQQTPALLEAAHHHLEARADHVATDLLLEASETLLARLQFHAAHRILDLLLNHTLTTDADRRAWILRSAVANGLGRSEEAATALEKARDLEPRPCLESTVELATLFAQAGRPADAESLLELHELPEQGPANTKVAATGLLILAEIARQRGHLTRTRSLAALAGDVLPGAAALTEGSAWFREGRLQEAQEAYTRASHDALPTHRARARHNLALIALREGHPLDASRMLQENLTACETDGEWFGVAISQLNLGVAYEDLERFAAAEHFHVQAIELLERLERPINLIGALSSLGDLALHLGELRRAQRLLERGRDLAESKSLGYEHAYATMRLASVAIERRRLGQAESRVQQADEWFSANGHHGDRVRALLVRIQLELARGHGDTAAELLETIETLEPTNEPRLALEALLLEAETLLMLGEPSRAVLVAQDAMDAARALGMQEPLVRAHGLAGQATWSEGNPQAAQTHCTEADRLLNTLKNEVPLAKRDRFLRRTVFKPLSLLRSTLKNRDLELPVKTAPPPRPDITRPHPLRTLLGSSPLLEKTLSHAQRFAALDAPVLIRGESGTGKDLLAEALHHLSPLRKGPLVRVNAAALADSLLESELFGHERGAFTGAERQRKGAFETAHGGMLFLDEIGDISPRAQKMLLRVLETGRFQRVGGNREIRVNVRVVCATHRNLEEAVAQKEFRLDLYHRISALTLTMPALRDRAEDIPILARHFLSDLNTTHQRNVQFAPSTLRALNRHAWPGNVRELQHAIQRAFHLSEGDVLRDSGVEKQKVAPRSSEPGRAVSPSLGETGLSLDDAKRDLEIRLIREALERTHGNITHAARLLQMSRPRLSQKSREYGIRDPGSPLEEKS